MADFVKAQENHTKIAAALCALHVRLKQSGESTCLWEDRFAKVSRGGKMGSVAKHLHCRRKEQSNTDVPHKQTSMKMTPHARAVEKTIASQSHTVHRKPHDPQTRKCQG